MESLESAISNLLDYDEQYRELKEIFRTIVKNIEKTPGVSQHFKIEKFETRLQLEFLDTTYELSFSPRYTERGLKGVLSMKRLLVGEDAKQIFIQQIEFDRNGRSWVSQFDSWRLMDEGDSQLVITNWLIEEIKNTAVKN